MRIPGRARAVAAALALILLGAGAAPAGQGPAEAGFPLARLVPPAAELGDWSVKDGPQAFEGDDLFLYIDGGAEIYREYGFSRVLVQDYWRGEDSISLEIFEMTDAAAAFGIFSFKRGPNGKPADIGTGSSLEGYYLNFWKGRFLVTVTGMNTSEPTVRAILAAARAVDSRLGGSGGMPSVTGALPEEGLVPSSLKYLKGPLALRNVYSFFAANVFAFDDGIKGDYADGHSLFVLTYASPAAARDALGRAEAAFREGEKYHGLTRDRDSLRVEDEDGRAFRCAARGRALVIVSGAAPGAEASLIDEAAARLPDEGA